MPRTGETRPSIDPGKAIDALVGEHIVFVGAARWDKNGVRTIQRVRSLIIKLDGRGGQIHSAGEGQGQGNKLRAGTVLQNGRVTEAAIAIRPVRHAVRICIIGVDRYDLPRLCRIIAGDRKRTIVSALAQTSSSTAHAAFAAAVLSTDPAVAAAIHTPPSPLGWYIGLREKK